jgi:hypothetical protein
MLRRGAGLPELVVGAHHVLGGQGLQVVMWPFSPARARAEASSSRLMLLVQPVN